MTVRPLASTFSTDVADGVLFGGLLYTGTGSPFGSLTKIGAARAGP